jgi:hypothetical protein
MAAVCRLSIPPGSTTCPMLLGKDRSAKTNTPSLQSTTTKYFAYGRNIVQQPFPFSKTSAESYRSGDDAAMQTVPAKGRLGRYCDRKGRIIACLLKLA